VSADKPWQKKHNKIRCFTESPDQEIRLDYGVSLYKLTVKM